jgi:hypothetical protein
MVDLIRYMLILKLFVVYSSLKIQKIALKKVFLVAKFSLDISLFSKFFIY